MSSSSPNPVESDPTMKTETAEQITKGALAISGVGLTWTLQDVSAVVAICVGIATTSYVLVQLFFLLRKWWLLERNAKLPSWDSTK